MTDGKRPWAARTAEVIPRVQRRNNSFFVSDRRLGVDDLLATVVTIGGHVVAQMGFARGRIGRQLLGRQRVVRTAHAALGRGNAGLLNCHGLAPENSLIKSWSLGKAGYLFGFDFNADSAANGFALL
jgi:hypothetical protein